MEDLVIANRLKLARIEKDLTQGQVAELAGVTRQTIGLIEAGKYNPSLKLCLILSKITGKGLDELFWIKHESDE
jgi:putative transcriptional regulator